MASSTKSPSTMANDATVGINAWANVDNAKASDNVYATCNNGSGEVGNYLKATNFGFAIPAGATIDGIEVSTERHESSGLNRNTNDSIVRMVKGGTISGDDNAGLAWTTSDVIYVYGGAADLWGLTWTVADINASDFGFVISAQETVDKDNSSTASMDHIQITVHYTVDGVSATSRMIL